MSATARALIGFVLIVLASSASMEAQQFGFEQNSGVVKRLYPEPGGTYFSLTGGQTAMNPVNGYYFIPNTHTNYNALVQLLYTAAKERWKLKVRTQPTLRPNGSAEAVYLVVDF
ncbi:MAG TPA: hypothetical protein VIG78_03480 [Gemmatimonadaceae bacterium]